MECTEIFSKNFSNYVEYHEIPYNKIARDTAMSTNTLCQIKNGAALSLSSIITLCAYLEITPNKLLDYPSNTLSQRKVKLSQCLLTFGIRLCSLMKERSLTYLKMCAMLDISVPTINSYMVGKTLPKLTTLTLIADIFDTSPDYLLGFTEIR